MKQLKRHLPEIVVDDNDPFLNCKLGRKSIAPILADVVSTYGETGTVIALDGAWGTGKTTFVRMWKRYLERNGFAALYFNAWECDFVEDPLIALVGELKELRADDPTFKKVASVATKVLTTGAIEFGKGVLKKVTGADYDKIVDKASDVFEQEFTRALDQYSTSKATLKEFKSALQEYVAVNVKDIEHPVVIIIDELDRCNPTFAVKTLERIKHLFDIPNLVFVLATNKEQLQYAIQGYYGSPNLDGNAYLRRFIDQEYSLPAPATDTFCKYLFDQYEFSDFFDSQSRKQYSFNESESDLFLNMMAKTIGKSTLSLRSIDKIINHCRLSLKGFGANQYVHPDILITLCYMKMVYPEAYLGIKKGKFKMQELLDVLEMQVFNDYIHSVDNKYSNSERQLSFTIGKILTAYNIGDGGIERFEDFKPSKNDNGESVFPVHSNVDDKELQDALNCYHSRFNSVASTDHIIKRIEITQPIQH